MPTAIPRSLVEFILLGPEDDRRQVQDSPILGDVWVEFGKHPGERLDLLITPYKDYPAGTVAAELDACKGLGDACIAYLQGIVAARLTFEELIRFVAPMSHWWTDKGFADAVLQYAKDAAAMRKDIRVILTAAVKWQEGKSDTRMQDVGTRRRYIALAGLLLWGANGKSPARNWDRLSTEQQIRRILGTKDLDAAIAKELNAVWSKQRTPKHQGLIWTVSLNRRATAALTKSVPAVKADAARTLFTVKCSDIAWAVVDSGVDASHPAFCDAAGKKSRVEKAFDFTTIRELVSLDNFSNAAKRAERVKMLSGRKLAASTKRADIDKLLKDLAEDARNGLPINWAMVERLVEIDPRTPPANNHGTHVAGILAAERKDADNPDCGHGMCPDIRIYDFRVLAPTLRETEFAVIAALQYIRYLNESHSYMTIHGANLSLSIPHDVRNYACGWTPVCVECERLVNSGVVVAAAGNRGYQNFETKDGLYESYAAFSVTDPGNADGVITVGATHRFWPHTYGVSFFSSRGPTGDGRLKPDLVAPGERIRAPLPQNAWGDLDGTSMAAPHVSGAAAMLMARYSDLIGQPRRIKKILCATATDLGRERSFQGHGMLDVLRAFQSI
jgi:hypothetical protein